MDNQTPNNLPTGSDPSFQVMPQSNGSASTPTSPPPPPAGKGPMPPPAAAPSAHSLPSDELKKSKLPYLVIALVVLLVLGALAYFLLGSKEPEATQPQSRLPKTWMTMFFNKEVCDEQSTCGDDADPDSDGLTNYNEFKEGASPINPDTDKDGLADGDEINIFETDPALKYTDKREIVAQNDWTDGFQVKNGFDPLTPGFKFTETRLSKIEAAKTEFGLHEPTTTTLK